MKHLLKSFVAVAALSASIVTTQAVELTIATWLPPSHPMTAVAMPNLAKMMSDATNGSVTGVIKTGVGSPVRMIDFVQDGVVDIAYMFNGYNPGRFVGTKIIELPGYEGGAEAISVAYWNAHQKYLAKLNEHKGVKVIGLMVHGAGQLHVSDKISDLASLSGKKIRVGGGVMGAVAKELGIVGVKAPGPKVYEILASGVADGVMMPAGERKFLKVNEVTAQMLQTPGGFYRGAFSIIMSQEKYDSMSDAEKAGLDKIFGEQVSAMAGKAWQEGDGQGVALTKETGKPILSLSDADEADLDAVFASVTKTVYAELEAKGVPAAEAHAYIKAQIAAYK